jgi:transposase InsO family protein
MAKPCGRFLASCRTRALGQLRTIKVSSGNDSLSANAVFASEGHQRPVRKGNCWDNAPTESFFNSLKNERVHGTRYATRAQAVADLFDYVEVFYNRSRRHSTLGYRSPVQFLQDWITTQHERKITA